MMADERPKNCLIPSQETRALLESLNNAESGGVVMTLQIHVVVLIRQEVEIILA